jgi:hypothetical protein
MAKKPFYSMEEVCAKLGKNQDQIKALVRDGELREFRDAGKVFFKVEDIDRLAAAGGPTSKEDTGEILLEAAGEGEVDLDDAAGSGGAPALHESSGGTSIIGLEPLADEEEPSPARKKDKEKEDTVITKSGIGVFDDDELEIDADPMAKTQITTGATESDQITLEGAGSGSGLLDLAREADDTALGADLLDEIYPGEEEQAPAAEEPAAEAEAEPEPEAEAEEEVPVAEAGEVVMPVIAVGDPYEGMFSGLLVGALILMGVAATVVAGGLQGFFPDYAKIISDGSKFWFFLGGSALLAVIALLAGWFLGKAFSGRRR